MDLFDQHFFSLIGFTLNPEEKVVLSKSLAVKKSEEKFQNISMFAKITAVKTDYYLAYAHNEEVFDKKYFYCVDLTTWFQLPDISIDDLTAYSYITGPFTGDISFEYRFDVNGESEKMNEEMRLACVVVDLLHDTNIVPRGAFCRNEQKKLIVNPSFSGLTYPESGKLLNYFHFRAGYTVEKEDIVHRGETFAEAIDIFDALVKDQPQGQWSLQVDTTEKIIQIKSFKWPGAFFYHALGQAKYANFYYGTGQKNNYVGLMLN